MTAVIKLKRSETALSIPSASDLEAGELALNIADGKFFTKTFIFFLHENYKCYRQYKR